MERPSCSGGPGMRRKFPVCASMHPCRQGAQQLAGGLGALECADFRGHSMPSQQLSRSLSNRETTRCAVSLGPLPVDRTDVILPASKCSAYTAVNGGVHTAHGESQGVQENPFASSTV